MKFRVYVTRTVAEHGYVDIDADDASQAERAVANNLDHDLLRSRFRPRGERRKPVPTYDLTPSMPPRPIRSTADRLAELD